MKTSLNLPLHDREPRTLALQNHILPHQRYRFRPIRKIEVYHLKCRYRTMASLDQCLPLSYRLRLLLSQLLREKRNEEGSVNEITPILVSSPMSKSCKSWQRRAIRSTTTQIRAWRSAEKCGKEFEIYQRSSLVCKPPDKASLEVVF